MAWTRGGRGETTGLFAALGDESEFEVSRGVAGDSESCSELTAEANSILRSV